MSRCFRRRHNVRQSWWYRWRDHHLVTPYIPQQTLIFPKTLHFTPRHYFGILRYTPENPLYPTGGHLTIDIPLYPKTPHPLTPKDIPLYLRKPTIPQDIQLYPKTPHTLRHLHISQDIVLYPRHPTVPEDISLYPKTPYYTPRSH